MPDVNVYFDGNVKSLTLFDENRRATVGVMEPGEYEFGTSQHEEVQVLVGTMEVKLPGEDAFAVYGPGETFEVAANQKFQLRLGVQVAYLCWYD